MWKCIQEYDFFYIASNHCSSFIVFFRHSIFTDMSCILVFDDFSDLVFSVRWLVTVTIFCNILLIFLTMSFLYPIGVWPFNRLFPKRTESLSRNQSWFTCRLFLFFSAPAQHAAPARQFSFSSCRLTFVVLQFFSRDKRKRRTEFRTTDPWHRFDIMN